MASGSGTHLDSHTKQRLKDLKRQLCGLTVVLVNSPLPRLSASNEITVNRQRDLVQIGDWTLSIEVNDMQPSSVEEPSMQSSLTLRIEPRAGRSGCPISVYFGKRFNCFETVVLHPTVFAYRTVPSSSVVFKLVAYDDVQGLKQLLINQQATTRDCDEWNRSLLYVRCTRVSAI